jgi:hypothetical protein
MGIKKAGDLYGCAFVLSGKQAAAGEASLFLKG